MKEMLTGGEEKSLEYAQRILAGEDKEKVLEGLGPVFRDAVEKQLGALKSDIEKKKEGGNVVVPENIQKEQESITERIKDDEVKIDELREKINATRIAELNERIEKYKVSLPNLDSIIANGGGNLEVVINGKTIEFDKFIIMIGPETENGTAREANVGFIEKKNRTEDRGIGVPIYIELGKKLAEKGIVLSASGAQHEKGQSIWMDLAKLGLARRVNASFEFTV